MKKTLQKIGRPTAYCDEIAERILELLADGQALHQLCKAEDLPSSRTVYRWLNDHPDFARRYAQARESQADAVFERGFEAAWNADDVALGRLRLDATKWYCSKLSPRKYSDKFQVETAPAQDFIPLDELRRRIEESKARRAALEPVELVENRVLAPA
jgi:hypothetical protein